MPLKMLSVEKDRRLKNEEKKGLRKTQQPSTPGSKVARSPEPKSFKEKKAEKREEQMVLRRQPGGIAEKGSEYFEDKNKRKVGRRKNTRSQTGRRPGKPPRPATGPQLMNRPRKPRIIISKDPEIIIRKKIGGMNKMLSGGQAKIAAKAPPTNKIDEKDFAVLRAEKAKGRGQGLQDEKMKPGKVMKARAGKMFSKGKGTASEFLKRRKELTGTGAFGFSERMKAQEQGLIDKKTGAGAKDLMKRAKSVKFGKRLLIPIAIGIAGVQALKSKIKKKKEEPKKKMGGGMMQRPMGMTGYKKGTMIKAIGGGLARSKPTKMY